MEEGKQKQKRTHVSMKNQQNKMFHWDLGLVILISLKLLDLLDFVWAQCLVWLGPGIQLN